MSPKMKVYENIWVGFVEYFPGGIHKMLKTITSPKAITILLILQLVPLVLFPLESFTGNAQQGASQEWWLPFILGLLILWAIVEVIFRRNIATWPWHLFAFAQGFNIISRLMMILPHAILNNNGVQSFDVGYVSLTLLSIILSALFLWYTELPETRLGLIRE